MRGQLERWVLVIAPRDSYQLHGPYASELERGKALSSVNGGPESTVLALDLKTGGRPMIRLVTIRNEAAAGRAPESRRLGKPNARRPKQTTSPAARRTALTPIDELGLRPGIVSKLKSQNVETLADVAALSKTDVFKMRGVGRHMIEQLKSALDEAGLSFAPPADPVAKLYWTNQRAREAVGKAGATIDDEAALHALGLSGEALKRATRKGIATVGELMRYSPVTLYQVMSKRAVLDTMERLALFGRGLQPEPPARLYAYGLLDRSEYLATIDARTPLAEIRHLLEVRAYTRLVAAKFERAGDVLRRSTPQGLSRYDLARVDRFVLEMKASLEARRAALRQRPQVG